MFALIMIFSHCINKHRSIRPRLRCDIFPHDESTSDRMENKDAALARSSSILSCEFSDTSSCSLAMAVRSFWGTAA